MANSFFDWVVSQTRFVKLDIARAEDINAAFDEVSVGFEEVESLTDSAIKVPSGEDALTLPAAATRKGCFLTFNSTTGVAETTLSVASVLVVTTNIDDVETVAENIDSVLVVTANIDDVVTVAENIDSVLVATTNIGDVETVAENIDTIVFVADNMTDIQAAEGFATQAETSATNSAASAADSAASAAEAESFAQTAILAPGTSATSVTSMAIGLGSKTFTIEAGKSLVTGMKVIIAVTALPETYMFGTLTSYSGTTAIVNVSAVQGSGTYSAWTMSLSAHSGNGNMIWTWVLQ
jgi:hypothetical protein